MIAFKDYSRSALAACLASFAAIGLTVPASAADKAPKVVVKPTPNITKATPPARSTKSEPDQIVCVAGCDSISPIVVQERPAMPYVEPARPQWVEQTWDVHCADGLGCRARNVLPMPSSYGHSTTIMIFRDLYWR